MHPRWIRYRKLMAAMACGGITLGVVQGFALVNFAQLFTNILSVLFASIVRVLLGANPGALLQFLQQGQQIGG